MKKVDPALSFPNPRLLAAVYFGLLSVVGTILISTFLDVLGIEDIIPIFQAVLLGMLIASIMGAVFGERIIHCEKPYKMKTFLMGFSMVMASLPLFALGLVFLMKSDNSQLFSVAKFHDMVLFYFVVLAYSYVLFGFVLAIASGLASMYLRGQLVYDVLHTNKRRRHAAKHVLERHKATRKVHSTPH